MTPEDRAELEKKKKAKLEQKAANDALPMTQAHKWLNKLPADITAAKQAIAKATANATMPQSIKAEYAAIFQRHLKGLEDARGRLEDMVCPGKDTTSLAQELHKASEILTKFRADNKAFSKSCDVYEPDPA